MSDEKSNDLEIRIKLNKKTMSTQLALGIAIVVTCLVTDNSRVQAVLCIALALDAISLFFVFMWSKANKSVTSSVTESPTVDTTTEESSSVRKKPKPLMDREDVVGPDVPEQEEVVEQSMSDDAWRDFFEDI